jgi:hypothetical protein
LDAADVFALGICIFHAVVGKDPATFPAGAGRLVGLLKDNGFNTAALLVQPLFRSLPASRPSSHHLLARIKRTDFGRREVRHPRHKSAKKWMFRAAYDAAASVGDYNHPTGRWTNGHFQSDFLLDGINLGSAGIVIGLLAVQHSLRRRDYERQIIRASDDLASSKTSAAAGLFTGNSGVALSLALVARKYNRLDFHQACKRRLEACEKTREYDLFLGSAGVVHSACMIARLLDETWPLEIAEKHVRHIMAGFTTIDGLPLWPMWDGTVDYYLGAAHGSSGIALALGSWASLTRDKDARALCLRTIKGVEEHIGKNGGMDISVGKSRERMPVINWCHGLAGYLWCALQLEDFVQHQGTAAQIYSILEESILASNSTYCHGVSGLLELWRMLSNDPALIQRAEEQCGRCVDALRRIHIKRGGRIMWHSEEPSVTTPDLWIGFLGPASALSLYLSGSRSPLLSERWLRQVTMDK